MPFDEKHIDMFKKITKAIFGNKQSIECYEELIRIKKSA